MCRHATHAGLEIVWETKPRLGETWTGMVQFEVETNSPGWHVLHVWLVDDHESSKVL